MPSSDGSADFGRLTSLFLFFVWRGRRAVVFHWCARAVGYENAAKSFRLALSLSDTAPAQQFIAEVFHQICSIMLDQQYV